MNIDESPASVAAVPVPATAVLGLLEVLDRGGSTLQRLPIWRWPVTVGRALTADLVLDDSHVAGEHLRIDAAAPGALAVHVLDTVNGVQQGAAHYPRGTQFNWLHGQELGVGRSRLRLRLAEQPMAPEQALPRFDWRNALVTLLLLGLVAGLTLAEVWLGSRDTSPILPKLGIALGGLLGILLLWAGVWALATKLFTGQPQFWRHVRIVVGAVLLTDVLFYLASVASFAFAWDRVERYRALVYVLVLCAGLHLQLQVITPHRRKTMAALVLGLAAVLSSALVWKDKNQSQPYLANFYPPAWRMAAPVPVSEWMQEAGALRQRLDTRLQNDAEEAEPEADDSEDE